MAGAKVALLTFADGDVKSSVMTDDSGAYSFTAVENVSPYSGALVSISKTKYFTITKYIMMTQDLRLDFDLEPAAYIPLGLVVRSPIGSARCASLGYGGGSGADCQRFGLIVPASGTLQVTVSSTPAAPFDISVLSPEGSIGVYRAAPSSPFQVSLPVTAGLDYQIDVVAISPATRDFELSTTVR